MDQRVIREVDGLVHIVKLPARARVRGDAADNIGQLNCGRVYFPGDLLSSNDELRSRITEDPPTCLRCIGFER